MCQMQNLFMFMYVVYQNIVMIDWALKIDDFFETYKSLKRARSFIRRTKHPQTVSDLKNKIKK